MSYFVHAMNRKGLVDYCLFSFRLGAFIATTITAFSLSHFLCPLTNTKHPLNHSHPNTLTPTTPTTSPSLSSLPNNPHQPSPTTKPNNPNNGPIQIRQIQKHPKHHHKHAKRHRRRSRELEAEDVADEEFACGVAGEFPCLSTHSNLLKTKHRPSPLLLPTFICTVLHVRLLLYPSRLPYHIHIH